MIGEMILPLAEMTGSDVGELQVTVMVDSNTTGRKKIGDIIKEVQQDGETGSSSDNLGLHG